MTLGEMIKRYREENSISMDEFARRSGISKGYISMLEANRHPTTGESITPSIIKIRQAAQGMGRSFDSVFAELEGKVSFSAPHRPAGAIPLDADAPRIKVLGRVAAGVPIDAIEDIIGTIDVPELKGREKEYFALQVQGDSMSPKIEDGDIVIIHEQPDAESGEIVVASVNGHDATCKKLLKYDAGITLLPLNSNYDPIVISNTEVREKPVTIYGKVKEIRRKL